jgi:small subunit ribosomal protein S8
MSMTDPIADMLTRMRNAATAGHGYVAVPSSKMKVAVAQILKDEGYIQDFAVTRERPQPVIRIWLKYVGQHRERRPMITSLKRVSKPGCRVYVKKERIPWVLSGIGIAILSTSKGVMTGQKARQLNVGGEVLCYVW